MKSDLIQEINDSRGCLVPIEFNKLDFIPKRLFIVNDVPKGVTRGEHAHYKTKQLLVCLKGEIDVITFDGTLTSTKTLYPFDYFFIDSMIWDSQKFLTGNDILMVLCSTKYDKNDYINDIDQFKELVNK